ASYAVLPWLALMMCGFGFGELAKREDFPRWSFVVGVVLTLTFVGLRLLNVYGDPEPWASQNSAMFTLLSFLNTSKYPPSLLFLLMTIGPLLVVLSLLSHVDASRAPWRWLLTFGRVPLFYYVLHLWLLRIASIVCALVVWGFGPEAYMPPPDGHAGNPGWSLAVTYLVWALALLVLYRPSRAFVELKRRRDDWWLAYL
ncbi:MAG: putative membrane protein, partial [Polyangiales bacterium]